MKVRLVISGRNYDSTTAIPEHLTLPEGCSLAEALGAVAELLPERRPLPKSCLVVVSGKHLGTVGRHRPHELADGDDLVVIAPVAGG